MGKERNDGRSSGPRGSYGELHSCIAPENGGKDT